MKEVPTCVAVVRGDAIRRSWLLAAILVALRPQPAATAVLGHSRLRPGEQHVATLVADKVPALSQSHYVRTAGSPSPDAGHTKPCGNGAEAVAMGLIFAVVTIPILLYMAMAPGPMSELVLKLVDTSISIFLAVLWFSAFSALLGTRRVHDMFPYAEEVFALLQVVALYVIMMVVAYFWRDKEMRLVTFAGCGAHYVAFAGIRAIGETQNEAAKAVANNYGHWMAFLACVVGIAILICVFRITHVCWVHRVGHDKLREVVDDIELDIIGLIGSFAVTQALRHALTGQYPQLKHLFFQQPLGGAVHHQQPLAEQPGLLVGFHAVRGNPDGKNSWQKWFLLGWSVLLTVIAACSLTYLNRVSESASRCVSKTIHIAKVVLVMCIAWGYLLWGEWTFNEAFLDGDPMFGEICFSSLATLTSLALITVLARLNVKLPAVRQTTTISITGASLVAAWSWEHCFDHALDVIGKKYQVGYDGMVPKAVLAFFIPLAVLPVYVTYIKPRVMEAEGHEHEEKKEKHDNKYERKKPGERGDERVAGIECGLQQTQHGAGSPSEDRQHPPPEVSPAAGSDARLTGGLGMGVAADGQP